MSNILAIYTNKDPATELSILLLERFSKYINAHFETKDINSIKRIDIDSCDILISIRTQSFLECCVIEYAKQSGKLYGLLIDDDFLSIPDYKIRRHLQYKALITCIKNADLLFCTNDSLGQKLQSISNNSTFVRIDTAVDTDELKPYTTTENNTISIVYYVNDGSLYEYNEIVQPIIEKCVLLKECRIEWHLMGIKPSIRDDRISIIHLYEHMDLKAFKDTLANSGFSFGIAPLSANEFNSGKYVNKYIEYTCAGLPCIYSNVEPYASFIRNNTDGILVNNTDEEWIDAILKLGSNELRKKLVNNAQSRMVKDLSYESVFEKIIEQYPNIKDFHSAKADVTIADRFKWLTCVTYGKIIMLTDPLFRIRGRLKCEGIKSLVTYSLQKIKRSKV